ncbi:MULTISPECIES: acyl-CoA dehydrogenase family protein [unclassified Streptomyces]|uniref:acyl-CoA dehydrogenase family protein n=1 Tax=unclassified Streptomyces TaxID=2593676 RepID=UPI000DB906B1|nr:acyl-CoA dehydrogenase family protein [Streptomyces sp. PsTaAH-130]MYU03642.1 acyl-CoA dehydrogenase [Streptomyces sp. SID8366]MYU66259.1 acyl-CoA dehydrogenase [Streptomyces sp. SID69]RAJ57704.1 alkylation response protein AidB-like acyl-CoA dehydrogenase [Streptomyces sp. PsTaAH-130]
MNFLHTERAVLDRLLPGLDAALAAHPLAGLERAPSPAIEAFREAGGPGLLVPAEHSGAGATVLQAVRAQRAVGARCPSLAVATTMHHFSVAGLVETARQGTGMEGLLLTAVARERLLLASGFAEGNTGQNILRPGIRAELRDGRVVLNGSKKPCSLSRSMDLLTASVALTGADGVTRLAVAIVPAKTPGLSVRPFWNSPVLAGAESDEVVLTEVELDPQMVVATEVTADAVPDSLNVAGFLWFELLLTAGYVGVASALVERVLARPGGFGGDPTPFLVDIEAAMLAVEAVAMAMETEAWDDTLLVRALHARYAAQDAIARTSPRCLSALGGMAFIGSPDGTYLASAAAGLAFHPPSRSRMAEPLREHLGGARLRIG